MCGIGLYQDIQVVESLVNSLATSSELEDDSTSALKRLQQAHQEGLQIEYRSPKCAEDLSKQKESVYMKKLRIKKFTILLP